MIVLSRRSVLSYFTVLASACIRLMLFISMTVESNYHIVYENKVWQNRDLEGDVLVICPLHVERIGMPGADFNQNTITKQKTYRPENVFKNSWFTRVKNLFKERPT